MIPRVLPELLIASIEVLLALQGVVIKVEEKQSRDSPVSGDRAPSCTFFNTERRQNEGQDACNERGLIISEQLASLLELQKNILKLHSLPFSYMSLAYSTTQI